MIKKIQILFCIFLSACVSPILDVDKLEKPISGPVLYNRPNKDGHPWWDVDVNFIKDAIPEIYTGSVKNAPYTVRGKKYVPLLTSDNYEETGFASWYGTRFHGKKTANGEIYDLYSMSAAHRTLPLPSFVKVTNLKNNKSIIVRVNDRGPFYSDRIIDLSFAAAKKLEFENIGLAFVKVQSINPNEWWENAIIPETIDLEIIAYQPPNANKANVNSKKFTKAIWPVSPNKSLENSLYCSGEGSHNYQKCDYYHNNKIHF